ncbi:DnaJ-domain-containing protein [Hypoxylon sp. FL1150]|nr:DnaJ-domain-containing protein [Hypoxylon sp. FL1150]
MDKSDLLLYAKEYATSQDLYELLGVTSDTPKEDIHRAWRKRSLKYHPDKAGDKFDATKWELFERARDVLSDAAARDVYDSQRSAALVREEQRRAMDAKKRAMIEDLEARERGEVKRPRTNGSTMGEAERKQLLEAGKRRMAERQRLMREAEERERQREKEREAEEENQKKKAKPPPSPTEPEMDLDPEPPTTNGDDYDDRIADLERRLKAARERKAARKAAKKEKKVARKGGDKQDAQDAPTPAPAVPEELKADEQKETTAPAKTFSFAPRTEPRVKGDFSSTMARLRAAQAEKEARKRAEEAAAATTSTTHQ